MKPAFAFRYCLRCAGRLRRSDARLLICPSCGYHLFLNPIPCTAAILFGASHDILLVKRRFPPKKHYWDLPGGFMHGGETFEESLTREIDEELHVTISSPRFLGSYPDTYLYDGVVSDILSLVGISRIPHGTLRPSDDISAAAFFPQSEIFAQRLAFPSLSRMLRDAVRFLKVHPLA